MAAPAPSRCRPLCPAGNRPTDPCLAPSSPSGHRGRRPARAPAAEASPGSACPAPETPSRYPALVKTYRCIDANAHGAAQSYMDPHGAKHPQSRGAGRAAERGRGEPWSAGLRGESPGKAEPGSSPRCLVLRQRGDLGRGGGEGLCPRKPGRGQRPAWPGSEPPPSPSPGRRGAGQLHLSVSSFGTRKASFNNSRHRI